MVRAAPGSHPELGTKFINAKVLLRKPAKSSPKNPTSKSSALSKLQISTSLPPYNSGCAESRPAVVWNSPIVKDRMQIQGVDGSRCGVSTPQSKWRRGKAYESRGAISTAENRQTGTRGS
ncbi:uncharacterized protein [Physcomitrium patens]|nr:uncharacterized protein LOC112284894 [Physcomitrium patens]|eukprot:XP_024381012.1 uncharacterized protein LOC112284894 [Physcomitrella patens]